MHRFSRTLMDLAIVDGEVLCQDGQPFDRVAYSRFKYGFVPPAIDYGNGLAAIISDELFALAGNEPILIVSAPYKCLPTASEVIARALQHALSHRAELDGREPPVLVPFNKAQVGDSSYARAGEAERLQQLATLGLRIDESRIGGSHVLVVDDIRITGTAQKATAAYLESLQPASIWYLHAARLPEDIGTHPGLEDELNQTVAHTLEEILQQVANGLFELNTRVLRFILETTDTDEFRSFLKAAPFALLTEIHKAGVGNGVKYYEQHRPNLEVVYDVLWRRAVQHSSSAASAS